MQKCCHTAKPLLRQLLRQLLSRVELAAELLLLIGAVSALILSSVIVTEDGTCMMARLVFKILREHFGE